jgi:hypothetical protein
LTANSHHGKDLTTDIANTLNNISNVSAEELSLAVSKLFGSHGFLQCTCEKYPKVTYANQKMKDMIGINEENPDWFNFIKDNIYFMIPFGDRNDFREMLEEVEVSTKPIKISNRLLRGDGTYIEVTGWMSVDERDNDVKKYTLIYLPPNEKQMEHQAKRESSYFHGLESAYDTIFELNLTKKTCECIHTKGKIGFKSFNNIPMSFDSARQLWVHTCIVPEDREMMGKFFKQIAYTDEIWEGRSVVQSEFRLRWETDPVYHFIGIAVKLDSDVILFCCRDISNLNYPRLQSKESIALTKIDKYLDYFVSYNRHASAMALIEETDGKHSLVYGSSKICKFLGIEREDYLQCVSDEASFEKTLKLFKMSEENFKKLMSQKRLIKYQVTNKDGTDTRKFEITCVPHKEEDTMMYQILVYDNVSELSQGNIPNKGVFARTFGHFDLFLDGYPISFSSSKEKELMALLIDRNGGTLSPHEAISYLWEDEEISEKVSSRYRKLAMSLKNTLQKYGIENIIINNRGIRSIDVSAIKCDYYEMLAGNKSYQNTFHNMYMTDYSWGEETLSTLWDYS